MFKKKKKIFLKEANNSFPLRGLKLLAVCTHQFYPFPVILPSSTWTVWRSSSLKIDIWLLDPHSRHSKNRFLKSVILIKSVSKTHRRLKHECFSFKAHTHTHTHARTRTHTRTPPPHTHTTRTTTRKTEILNKKYINIYTYIYIYYVTEGICTVCLCCCIYVLCVSLCGCSFVCVRHSIFYIIMCYVLWFRRHYKSEWDSAREGERE